MLKELQELKECTFQPKLESNNSNTRKYMTGTLYERNLKWQENKEKRLQKERKKEPKEEISKCTFRPNIKESVSTFDRRQVARPGSGKEAKGINQFL